MSRPYTWKLFSSLFALTLTTYLTNSGNVGIRLALLIVLNLFLISLAISNLLGWMFWLLGSLANLSWNTTPVTCHHCFSVSCGHQVGWYESLEGVSDHEECCPRPEKPESGLAEEGGEPGPQYEYYVRSWQWWDERWPHLAPAARWHSAVLMLFSLSRCMAQVLEAIWTQYSAMNLSFVFIYHWTKINPHLEIFAIHNFMLDIISSSYQRLKRLYICNIL